MRGRKPKPTALKMLNGTRESRINRDEPQLPAADLTPPRWLDEMAVEHWTELAQILSQAGLLTEGDRPALALLCESYSRFRQFPLDDKARELYRRLLVEFGLTPSARSRVKAPSAARVDPLTAFFASRKA